MLRSLRVSTVQGFRRLVVSDPFPFLICRAHSLRRNVVQILLPAGGRYQSEERPQTLCEARLCAAALDLFVKVRFDQ
jgi:hypothetical protein